MGKEDHAVVVGITRYPSFEELRGPENDANAVYEWLVDKKGGDVPKKHVAKIVSSKFGKKAAEPTADQVYTAFNKLVALGESNDPVPAGRRLYIFLAGHGFGPGVREAALLMANAAPRWPGFHLNAGAIADYFAQAGYFREIVLLVDCCRDDLSAPVSAVLPWQPVAGSGKARWLYAYATGWSRKARERAFDDGVVHGIFTIAVLDALRTGPRNSTALENVVTARMLELADPNDHQEPFFQPGPGEIAFGAEDAKPTLIVTLKPGPGGGLVTISRGDGTPPFDQHTLADAEEWSIPLDSGLYELSRPGSGASQLIKIAAGEQRVEI
jgi:hypothetical protein